MNLIELNMERIRALCQKHKVSKLFAFGSVLSDKFNSESDIDLIVDFENVDLKEYADNYFNLKFSLEKLFHRDVDLLEEKAIKNPFFRKSVDNNRVLIYG